MPLRRLDDDGRAVINLSNQVAHEYGLEYVGTEHVLLAIVRHAQNAGARALHRLGLDESRVEEAVNEQYQGAKEDTWVLGRLPGSPHFRNVVERAMEIAEQLESKSIGPAHLLLALYFDEDSTAHRALRHLGVPQKKCRAAVLKELSQTAE